MSGSYNISGASFRYVRDTALNKVRVRLASEFLLIPPISLVPGEYCMFIGAAIGQWRMFAHFTYKSLETLGAIDRSRTGKIDWGIAPYVSNWEH